MDVIDEAIEALENSHPYSCEDFSLASDKKQNSDLTAHNKALEALRTFRQDHIVIERGEFEQWDSSNVLNRIANIRAKQAQKMEG